MCARLGRVGEVQHGDHVKNSVERWRQNVAVEGQKVIEADPRIVDAFKNIGYSLEAAIADLVDNSVDAGASTVLIRFLHTEEIWSAWSSLTTGGGCGKGTSTVRCSSVAVDGTQKVTSACTGWASSQHR